MIHPRFSLRFLLCFVLLCLLILIIGCATTGYQTLDSSKSDTNATNSPSKNMERFSTVYPATLTFRDSAAHDSMRVFKPFARDAAPFHIDPPAKQYPSRRKETPRQENSFLFGLLGAVLIDPLFERHPDDQYDYYCYRDPHYGNLSDAMKKASGEHSQDHNGVEAREHSHRDEHHERGSTTLVGDMEYDESTSTQVDSSAEKFFTDRSSWFSLSYGQGSLKSSDFYGYSDISIALEAFEDQKSPMNRVDLVAGGSHAPVQETSKLRRSLDGGVTLLHVGIRYNLYTTPRYTFMGNYVFAGAHINWLFWDYKNPVRATEFDSRGNPVGSSLVDSDDLAGLDLQVGAGWNIAQSHNFAAGIECTPGIILWSPETDKKFHNDVFDTFVYLRLSYMMHIRLGQ